MLVRDAHLPADVTVGDILATPVTGAYAHSMASNYNKVAAPGGGVRARRLRLGSWSPRGSRTTSSACDVGLTCRGADDPVRGDSADPREW